MRRGVRGRPAHADRGRGALIRLALLVLALLAPAAAAAPTQRWDLLATRPHDPTAFTEGLVAHGGVLIESTGLVGQSTIRRVNARNGKVLVRRRLPAALFGEGVTVLDGAAVQLTWKDRRVLSWRPASLRRVSTRPYPFEGWGLTTDGRSLIASDGRRSFRAFSPRRMRMWSNCTAGFHAG